MLLGGPYELPVARVHQPPTLAGAVVEWFAARLAWLRPRWIPVAVACAGASFLLAGTTYLTELAHREEPAPVAMKRQPGHWVTGPVGPAFIVDLK